MDKLVKLFSSLRPVSKAEKPRSETAVELLQKKFVIKEFCVFSMKWEAHLLNLDFKERALLSVVKKSA